MFNWLARQIMGPYEVQRETPDDPGPLMHRAAAKGDFRVILDLVAEGDDVNARDRGHVLCFTPLHFAAQNGRLRAVKALLKGGVKVDAEDNKGLTALFYAGKKASLGETRNDYDDIVRVLLKHGANPEVLGHINACRILQFSAALPIEVESTRSGTIKRSGLTLSSPTAKAFDPANAMVVVGIAQLNKGSKYLTDLPDEARAGYLISPISTATLFRRDLGTWNEDTASIRSIGESHGLHFNGQTLTGMRIFDRPENTPYVAYEKAWANEIRSAWNKANITGTDVVTELAIMPEEFICGRKVGSRDVMVANNMYYRVAAINDAIARQGREQIVTKSDSGFAHWQFTSTEGEQYRAGVRSVCLSNGARNWNDKNDDHSSSRAGALCVLAPYLAR